MTLRRKLYSELSKMIGIIVLIMALGVYAREFVISGIMAKPELNLTIIGTFITAAGISIHKLASLFNDVSALDAMNADYGFRRKPPKVDVYGIAAKVFNRPTLLGYGYRLITEELQNRSQTKLPTETIHLLVKDVDQRISDARSTLSYFGGLLVFLGLLGAFMGLMKTVHSVGDLIGSMDVSGKGGADSFGRMIEGMKGPLNGMSVGFSSSLFGLLFSMVVGLIDRFLISAMKSVRNDFEATLINMAELETMGHEQGHGHGAALMADPSSELQIAALKLTSEAFGKIRAATERTHEQLETLNANMAGAVFELRTQVARSQQMRASVDESMSAALGGIINSQKDLSLQMSRFADAAVAMAEDRTESQLKLVNMQERQIELLSDIANRELGGAGKITAARDEQERETPSNVAIARNALGSAPAGPAVPPVGVRGMIDRLTQVFQPQPRSIALAQTPLSLSRQLASSLVITQSLAREVFKRVDDTRREDRRYVRDLAARQEALTRQLGELSRQIALAMQTHDMTPRDRIDALRIEIENLQKAAANDLGRLETHIMASRRMAERAEHASLEASRSLDELQQRTGTRGRQH